MGTPQGETSEQTSFLQAKYLLPIAGLLIGAVLMLWKTPTPIELDLTVSQVKLTVASDTRQSIRLLDDLPFQLIAIQNFESIQLHPRVIKRADPKHYDEEEECFPDTSGAWEDIPDITDMTVHQLKGETSQVTFGWEGMNGCDQTGVLPTAAINRSQQLDVSPGAQVEMELQGEDARVLSLKITGDRPRLFVTMPPVSDVFVDGGQFSGEPSEAHPSNATQTYRIESTEENRLVEVQAGAEPLIVSLILPSDLSTPNLSQKDIPVSLVNVLRFEGGEWFSNLVAKGSLTYPENPEAGTHQIHEDDFVIVDELDGFYVRSLQIDHEQQGLHMTLVGTAGEIRTGLPDFTTDHRLSLFDQWFPVIQRLKDLVGL